jgi:hydrogenase maturation protease
VSTLETQACWVVGYGNRQRRDDGIGPYIVERLTGALQHRKEVHLLALPQLRADVVEDLREADRLLFVDATIDNPEGGRKWCRLHPDLSQLPYLTHHVHPAFLLGLMESLYSRAASAWLVSVQGSDFGFGEGLSPEAAETSDRVSREILEFISRKK